MPSRTLSNLANLSPAERAEHRDQDAEAYALRCVENLPYKAIAERLGISVSTAHDRCQRAEKRALKHAGELALASHAQQQQRLLHHYLQVQSDYEQERTPKRAQQVLRALQALGRHWGFGQAPASPNLSVTTSGPVQVNMTDQQVRALMGLAPLPQPATDSLVSLPPTEVSDTSVVPDSPTL